MCHETLYQRKLSRRWPHTRCHKAVSVVSWRMEDVVECRSEAVLILNCREKFVDRGKNERFEDLGRWA